jgi:hypothetical protein
MEKEIEMRIWFDTEFIEDGRTIDLISIGMVREDGEAYYAECGECDLVRADDWVQKNVFPYLCGEHKTRTEIASDIISFAALCIKRTKPSRWKASAMTPLFAVPLLRSPYAYYSSLLGVTH